MYKKQKKRKNILCNKLAAQFLWRYNITLKSCERKSKTCLFKTRNDSEKKKQNKTLLKLIVGQLSFAVNQKFYLVYCKNYFEQCDMIKNWVRYILCIKKKYSDWKEYSMTNNHLFQKYVFKIIILHTTNHSISFSLYLNIDIRCFLYVRHTLRRWSHTERNENEKKRKHMVTYPPRLASIKRKREKNYECHGTSKRSRGSGVNLKKEQKQKNKETVIVYYII